MGILDRFFGKGKDYPPLEPDCEAARKIEKVRKELETLAKDVKDPLEVIPGTETSYVFIGKPPRKYGMAFIQNGQVLNLQSFAQKKKLSETDVAKLSNRLTDVYSQNQSSQRYSTQIGDRPIVVNPSGSLKQALDGLLGAEAKV
jgi:hypothetical protein